jgi:hypothetical protein
MNQALRNELLAMAAEDQRVRQELLEAGELGKGYVPRMEAVHQANTARLKILIDEFGWPDSDSVGDDGTSAAWLIAQHAIGDPAFQRRALEHIEDKVKRRKVPAAHAAYLFDRIAMYEGRPQRYGTQYLLCEDGLYRRWTTEDPEQLDARRAEVGLSPAPGDPPPAEVTPESRAEYEEWVRGYHAWLERTRWR